MASSETEMELTTSMFATTADYWKARAEQAERTLTQVADTFGIGIEARTPGVILANARNAARRSDCLSRIEAHHTITVTDEDGEDVPEQILNWGDEPDQYIETYKAAVTANNQQNAHAERVAADGEQIEAQRPWPKERDVGRVGDMHPSAHLRVGLDADNDVYVSVWDNEGGGSVEFCCPGAGGGKSARTREALIALMVAIEADNAEFPRKDWWALRRAPAGE